MHPPVQRTGSLSRRARAFDHRIGGEIPALFEIKQGAAQIVEQAAPVRLEEQAGRFLDG
jgi:hypothetical protein